MRSLSHERIHTCSFWQQCPWYLPASPLSSLLCWSTTDPLMCRMKTCIRWFSEKIVNTRYWWSIRKTDEQTKPTKQHREEHTISFIVEQRWNYKKGKTYRNFTIFDKVRTKHTVSKIIIHELHLFMTTRLTKGLIQLACWKPIHKCTSTLNPSPKREHLDIHPLEEASVMEVDYPTTFPFYLWPQHLQNTMRKK